MELTQLLDDQSKTAPFDEGYQHVDAVGTGNLFFQFGKHLGLAHRPGEQAAAGQRRLRACQVCRSFSGDQQRVVGPQKSKKLLCPAVDAQRSKVSFLGCGFYGLDQPVCQRNLGREIPTLVGDIVQTALDHVGKILRQHLGGFSLVQDGSSLAGSGQGREFLPHLLVDHLFVQAGL